MGCGSSRASNVQAAADNFAAVSAQFIVVELTKCDVAKDAAEVNAALAAFIADAGIKALEKDKELFQVAKGSEAITAIEGVIAALKEKAEEPEF
jgi:hypothetical protein